MNRLATALAFAFAPLLLPACGHKGDPLPPLRRTPPAPEGFRVAQRGETIELRATAPAASVDGVPFETVTVEFLFTDGTGDLEKTGRRRTAAAAPGRRVVETVPLPAPGATLRAAARAIGGRHQGPRSLTTALVARPVVGAPSELSAVLAEDGVALSWRGPRPRESAPAASPATPGPGAGGEQAPASPGAAEVPKAAEVPAQGEAPAPAAEGAGPARSGFLVYRRLGSAEYDAPLDGGPLERRSFKDTTAPPGATACYVLRAASSIEPLVESAPSNEACVEVRDVAAPATPAGLAALPRQGGIEVLWGPSSEPDLASYRVYRTAPGGAPERLAELAPNRTSWLDETAVRGVAYRYAVSAVDAAGNESVPTDPVEATLP
jgi:hypothetical protein